VNDISNMITLYQDPFIISNFTISVYLFYNSTLPVDKNQTYAIQQAQQASLSNCKFNSTVALNSISAPIFIKTNVKLSFSNYNKKRPIDSSNCESNYAAFINDCTNQNQFILCNEVDLISFLNTYINETVILKYLPFIRETKIFLRFNQ
jgi:hypothetical protein